MALMTSMREKMHVVLWALLALLLLSMTMGGLVGGANIIDQLFGNVNPQTTIARINGQDISPDNFNNRVNQQLQNSRTAGQNIFVFQFKHQPAGSISDSFNSLCVFALKVIIVPLE